MEEKTKLEVIEPERRPLALTEEDIQTIQQNILMAERLVMTVLEKGVDYGIHPGTASMALRDPGASKIANAFNTYPEHVILHSREDEDVISYLVQAKLISRKTGQIVAVGVGACSTMETKYGYRWVETPEEYGYRREDLTRKKKGKYRIPNPEVTDLGNTILKMASKRSETDACQSLPGVGSALRKLFEPSERKEPDWIKFWGRMSQLGLSEEKAHEYLGVSSVKDWITKGKTIDEAIKVIQSKLQEEEVGLPIELAEEIGPPDSELVTGWNIVKGLLNSLKITQKQVSNYFHQLHKIEVNLSDFESKEPPSKITSEMLSKFAESLQAYKERQGKL